jgi:hypothetical protein
MAAARRARRDHDETYVKAFEELLKSSDKNALGRVARVVEKHGPSPSGVSTLRDLPRRSVRQVFPSIHPAELDGAAS